MQYPAFYAAPRCCEGWGKAGEADGLLLLAGMEDCGVLQFKLHLGGCTDGDVRSADEAGRVRGQEQNWPCKALAAVSPLRPAR